jgi:Protein of unknown function (DUF3311)
MTEEARHMTHHSASAPERHQRPLPGATKVMAGVLLAIPLVALAIVPSYAKRTPELWGMPFFYWYQFLWVFIASAFTWAAYVLITRARRDGDRP